MRKLLHYWTNMRLKNEMMNVFPKKMKSVTEGQRKHRSIALENLKSRLKYYCDGTFDIVIGEKDALATITIPYDKAKGGLFDENDHH
ncbi:MAG: hypothetical protein II174_05375 [Erysipelotrichaceae bacterium]|nr:hypothetical protein [Erysipelotrichaceae bacterium]